MDGCNNLKLAFILINLIICYNTITFKPMPCYNTVPISIIPPTGQGQGPLVWQNGSQINRLNIPLNPSWLVFDGSKTRWGDGSAQAPIYLPSLQQVQQSTINYAVGLNASGQLAAYANTTINPNNALVTATGSTTPRTLANRASDVTNVLDFGADPTGVVNSAPAIQAAINYVISLGNRNLVQGSPSGIVFLPPGTYKVNTSINFGTTTAPINVGIWVKGAGRSTVVLGNGMATTPTFIMHTKTASSMLSDMYIANNFGGNGVSVQGNGQLLNNLWINAAIGIEIASTSVSQTADIQISNVVADTCNASGLDIVNYSPSTTNGPFNISVSNFESSGGGAGSTNGYGIRISENVFAVQMTNIICSNQAIYGIWLLPITIGSPQRDINITNFVCETYDGIPSTSGYFNHFGIYAQSGQATFNNGTINGYPSSGVYITGASNIKLNNVNIFGNVTSSFGNPYPVYCELGSTLKISNSNLTGGLQVNSSGNITGTGYDNAIVRFTDNTGNGSFEVIDSTLSNATGNALYVDGSSTNFVRIESNKIVNGNQGSIIPIYLPVFYASGYIQNNYIYQANGTANTYAISVACGIACTNNTYRYGAFQNTGVSQPYLDNSNYTLSTPVPISHTIPVTTIIGTAVPICTINIATSLECVYLTATVATLVQTIGPQVLKGGWVVLNNGSGTNYITETANSNDTIAAANLAFSWVAGTTPQRAVLKVTQTGGSASPIFVSVSVNRGEAGTYLIQGAA
jgi:hypothetical protein